MLFCPALAKKLCYVPVALADLLRRAFLRIALLLGGQYPSLESQQHMLLTFALYQLSLLRG